jgi:hypothetical protein
VLVGVQVPEAVKRHRDVGPVGHGVPLGELAEDGERRLLPTRIIALVIQLVRVVQGILRIVRAKAVCLLVAQGSVAALFCNLDQRLILLESRTNLLA